LNLLTTSKASELRVDMMDADNVHKFAKYSTFQIGSESDKFRLTIGGYSGDAGRFRSCFE
jgi:hypothetical protein